MGCYSLTVPGDPGLPGLASVAESAGGRVPGDQTASRCSWPVPHAVAVTVPSKESRGTLVAWTTVVSLVDRAQPEWDEVIGPLAAARLDADFTGIPLPLAPARRRRNGAVAGRAPGSRSPNYGHRSSP